jgi:hypothetical protein
VRSAFPPFFFSRNLDTHSCHVHQTCSRAIIPNCWWPGDHVQSIRRSKDHRHPLSSASPRPTSSNSPSRTQYSRPHVTDQKPQFLKSEQQPHHVSSNATLIREYLRSPKRNSTKMATSQDASSMRKNPLP